MGRLGDQATPHSAGWDVGWMDSRCWYEVVIGVTASKRIVLCEEGLRGDDARTASRVIGRSRAARQGNWRTGRGPRVPDRKEAVQADAPEPAGHNDSTRAISRAPMNRSIIATCCEGTEMAEIDLHFVDELIEVRRIQHGGGRGAPPIQGGHRIGTSINRSCIVMLSALLQSYVEEVFGEAARRTFPRLNVDDAHYEKYWKQMKDWGNPSGSNVRKLFLKIGILDVFDGLSWQGTNTEKIWTQLETLNQIRNQIAHGTRELRLSGRGYSLSLARVERYRNFAEKFGERFSEHVDELTDRRINTSG